MSTDHRGPATTTEAAAFLADTPTETLLQSAYALTHRIEQASAERTRSADLRHRRALTGQEHDLRAQRDLVTAEVLRRTASCQCCDGRC